VTRVAARVPQSTDKCNRPSQPQTANHKPNGEPSWRDDHERYSRLAKLVVRPPPVTEMCFA
jgi:hypothetical protein